MKCRRITSSDKGAVNAFMASYRDFAGKPAVTAFASSLKGAVVYGLFDGEKLVGMFGVEPGSGNVSGKAGKVPDGALAAAKKSVLEKTNAATPPNGPDEAAAAEEPSRRGWAAMASGQGHEANAAASDEDDDLASFGDDFEDALSGEGVPQSGGNVAMRLGLDTQASREAARAAYIAENRQAQPAADPFESEFYSAGGSAFDLSSESISPTPEPAPVEPDKQQGHVIGKVIAVTVAVAIVAGIIAGAYFLFTNLSKSVDDSVEFTALNYSVYQQAPEDALAHVSVLPGDTLDDVKLSLCEAGMVSAARGIDDALKDPDSGVNGNIQSADYIVLGNESATDILLRMEVGKRVPNGVIGVNEGDTLGVISDAIDNASCPFTGDEFVNACRNWQAYRELYSELSGLPDEVSTLEGYILSDEYNLSGCANAADAVHVLLRASQKQFEQRNIDAHDWFVILTKASMIEKEALFDEDRPLIASVIENRVAENEFLQIDATVKYATGSTAAKVLYSDTEVESPYNTYVVRGLPVGPICSGISQASIDAAMNPAQTNFFYYVLKDEEGHHVFSETPEQFAEDKARFMELFGYSPEEW